jgi:hypothetical protein
MAEFANLSFPITPSMSIIDFTRDVPPENLTPAQT